MAECSDEVADETKKPAGKTTMAKVVKALEESMELMAMWQKTMKLAGMSKNEWKVVAKYQADKIMSSSNHEKKIKVERTAERKVQKKRKTLVKQENRNFTENVITKP